jgi:putative DNA primase/helicase
MTIPQNDLFAQVRCAALAAYPGLLKEWLPGGKLVGNEYIVLNPTRADHTPDSFKINVRTGKWSDFACDDRGGDPISLYAYLRCGGVANRVQACRELAEKFGLDGTAPVRTKPNLRVVEKNDDWQSIVPPPPNAGRPKIMSGATRLHTYKGAGGQELRFVARYDKANKKDFLPYTYGTLNGKPGWYSRHPNEPLCLYGLDRRAANPTGRVLMQEGEQKTDLVQERVPSLVCMAWSGGANWVSKHDFGPTAGVEVLVCGDAIDGEKAMMTAAEMSHKAGAIVVWTVDTSGFPKAWDLGNAVTGEMWKKGELVWKDEDGPWSAEKIEAFLRERSRLYEPDPGAVDEDIPDLGEPTHDDDSEWAKDPEDHATDDEGVIPLGHDNGIFYYLSRGTGQVHGLTPSKHVELELIALADPIAFWGKIPMFKKRDGDVNYKKAAAWMIRWCKLRGVFKPERIRGRGAWTDRDRDGKERAVLHLGESLIVGGVAQRSLKLAGSGFIYAKARSLGQAVAEPVRNGEAYKLQKMCDLLRWEKPISATLAAGFISIAPICGALPWRPSVWITGSSNSGKTTFQRDIIAPILGRGLDDGIALNTQSKTTEAGLRQMLGTDARPVIFDEAEAEQLADKTRMQAVIDLVRQSSSEGGAEIIKGTQNQSGAKRYRIRSCFMFSSINVSLDHIADESRITVLDLYNPGPHEMEADQARWKQLLAIMAETVKDPEWCAGMVARSVWLMHVIRANAETFKTAVLEKMGSSRVGDQLGTLLAGAYSLTSPHEISLDDAREYLARPENDFTCATSLDAPKDEERLLGWLMQQSVRYGSGSIASDRNVGELVGMAKEGDAEAAKLLKRNGFLFVAEHLREGQEPGVWVSNRHPAISKWLADTPWSTGWGRSLKRLPGAKSSEPKVIVFGTGSKYKAVWLPLPLLEEGNDG